jgi:phosphatidylinositol alpha-mannosyltransferase
MKIAIVSQSYYPRPGGVTEHVHHTALELRRLGHTVEIFTANFGADPHADPGVTRLGRNILVPHHGAWANMTVGWKLIPKLAAAFRAFQPDIIHSHCPLAPTLPLMAIEAAPPGSAVVGTFHAAAASSPGYRVFQKPLSAYAARLDTRIAVSESARQLAHKYFPGRYVLVPNGIDPRRFNPNIEPFERFRDGVFNVLFVGRMDRRKGLKYLFRAMNVLAHSGSRRIRLIVVGENGLRRLLLPRVDGRIEIHLAGLVSRDMLPRFYASSDVFCSPAVEKESFGIVLLEAMASGIPVVGTSIPGYLNLLEHRRNALVVPPRNPEALAAAVLELQGDDLLREKLRRNGLEFARRYSWDIVTAQLESVYRKTLSSTAARLSSDEIQPGTTYPTQEHRQWASD